MKSEPSLSPNRLPWPPMIVAAAIVSAATLNMIVPLSAGAISGSALSGGFWIGDRT